MGVWSPWQTAHARRCLPRCWPGSPPRLAQLTPPRPPGRGGTRRWPWSSAWTPSGAVISTGCRTGTPAAWLPSPRPRSATASTCCWVRWPRWGIASPTARSSGALQGLRERLVGMAATGEAVVVDGLATRVQRPAGGPASRCCTTPSATPTPPGVALSTVHGDLLWGRRAAGRAAAMSRRWWRCQGWMGCWTPPAWPPSSTGPGHGQGWRALAAPVGRPASKDRLSDGQRAFNRVPAGLRALVEQAIGHLASAWALRRWRGLLYRVREVFRAAGALVCLGRWLHRVPT